MPTASETVHDPWKHKTLQDALTAPEPRSFDDKHVGRQLVAGDDVMATYVRARFHTEVIVHGAQCRDCGDRLECMTTRAPLGTSRRREFPFKATLKQVRRGAHHNASDRPDCNGQLDFNVSLLTMNANNKYQEGIIERFVPDKEGVA